MSKLSRIAVATIAVAATTPALVVTPAAAAPLPAAVTVLPAATTAASAWCRIFPRLCKAPAAPPLGAGALHSR